MRIHDDGNRMQQSVRQKPISNMSALVKREAPKKLELLTKVRALYDYKAVASDELTLMVNDIITVLDKNLEDEGWWKVDSLFLFLIPGLDNCLSI